MEKIVRALLDIRDIKLQVDDDFTDRLNRQYTASLLVMCAVLVSARQYMGDPIHCWCPEQCASNHEKYANIFCWVSNTYYVEVDERLPEAHEPKRRITYYQWVPLILIAQASLFFLPCITWRFLNRRSGINISIIIESAKASQRAVYAESREKTLRYTVHLIDRYLLAQRDTRRGCLVRFKHVLSRHCFLIYGKFYGNYLTFTYLTIKMIYVLNAVGQLFILDFVLGYEFHVFGLHVMKHIINGSDWTQSVRFPRVTLCDFHIRHQTNVHRYTFQCVLPINVFNEKIFLLVWCWLLLDAILTLCSLIHWLKKSIYWPTQIKFVKRHLRSLDTIQRETVLMRKFTENYLRRDGLFLLRLVAKNAGELTAMEILGGLWENFGPKQRHLTDTYAKKELGCSGKMEVV